MLECHCLCLVFFAVFVLFSVNNCEEYQQTSLSSIPTDIPTQAEKVFLSHGRISTIPSQVFLQLENCILLDMSMNQIKDIKQGAFDGLKKLLRLDLSDNRIEVLHKNMFLPLTGCHCLVIIRNPLHQIELGAFNGLQNLQHLDLRRNSLTKLENNTFIQLTNLKELCLGNGRISTIETGTFNCLSKLRILRINTNPIPHLRGDMLKGLVSLRMLDMTHITLDSIHPSGLAFLPRPLLLCVTVNQNCRSLCWLKREERAGNITWKAGKKCHGIAWHELDKECAGLENKYKIFS